MNALIVLLGILSAALAVPVPFPRGKTVTYKYTADVKAGVVEPSPFASQFGLECLLHVRADATDPTLTNAYSIFVTDVKHAMHNGHTVHHEHLTQMHPISESAKAFENPFLVVYDENGHFQGLKFVEHEPAWSRNIKKGIASMLQLDLANIHVTRPVKAHSFITHEETIHGTCQVAYNVHAKDQVHPTSSNVFVVTKIHEPKNCTHFVHHEFNHVEPEKCHVPKQEDITTASRRVFEIEDHGDEILIKKLVGHGVINYLPWLAQSEAHYLLTNQTLVLQSVVDAHEVQLPDPYYGTVPIVRKIAFDKPETEYVPQADVDVTQGRHVVKRNELAVKLKKMLDEAASYVKENHLEKKQPDWKHSQTINRILYVMSFMNLEDLQRVFGELQGVTDSKEVAMRNIFLGIVPNVGTTAACLFTKQVVSTNSVSTWTAITMLANLPMHVKVPSKELLSEMVKLLDLEDPVPDRVKEAGIFCVATLVHKTFKDQQRDVVDPLLESILQRFVNSIRDEPTVHMKIVYTMAMKNVQLNQVLKHLEPIIKGEVVVSEKPHTIRLLAIWAIKHVVIDDSHHAHDLLWPILTDVSLPTAVRIVAYDVLISQLPHEGRLMNIHWLMVYEKDEHLYNYHIDTLKGLANSVDPCLIPIKEMARKVLTFSKPRHVHSALSSKIHVDYMDEKYGFGEGLRGSLIVNPLTGLPHIGSVEHVQTTIRKPTTGFGIFWNIEGLSQVVNHVNHDIFGATVEEIVDTTVKSLLNRAAQDMSAIKKVNINVAVTMNSKVVATYHADQSNWLHVLSEVRNWNKFINENFNNVNWQNVLYLNHFEMHVPTDLGVPAVLASHVPMFTSVKGHVEHTSVKNRLGLDLKIKLQSWVHGEHVMSIYNPIADVWHSVRKASTQDVVIPLEMHVNYNADIKSLKLILPRLPVTEFSVAGISTHAKNYVTIVGDENDQLKSSCDTCRHHEMVTPSVENTKVYESVIDSKDTGLKFTMAVYDCENNVTPVSPVVEWLNVLSDEHKNTMGYKLAQLVMGVRQQLMRDIISGQGGSCATLIKSEPSIVYPTSMIDLTGKISIQDLDYMHEKMHPLKAMRIDVRGSVNVTAAATDRPVRLWDMNLNVMLSQGHTNNTMKVMITRRTSGEKDLRICMEGQKDYQVGTDDILKIAGRQKESNSKMTVTMGHTVGDKCVRDELDVTVSVKGEMTEEQKKYVAHESVYGMCAKQKQYEMYQTDASLTPKTWECFEEALHQSTLRKYTVNMAVRKVPVQVMSTVNVMQHVGLSVFFPHIDLNWNHVEPGTVKAVLEFPFMTPVLDVNVVTPTHSYEVVELPLGHPRWNMLMDNVNFEPLKLNLWVNDQIKICSIFSQVLLNMDNGTIPYTVPTEWTLLSGDYVNHTFSVFVKLVQNNKLAVKFYVGPHELTITPVDSEVTVTVNNKVIDNYEKGVLVPENEPDSYAIRLGKAYGHYMIQTKWAPMHMNYNPNCVTIGVQTVLQGHVTGLCGHMDGTHKDVLPKVYSVSHL